jgi:hypothetical protein
MTFRRTLIFSAASLSSFFAVSAYAQVGQTIDPATLPPAQREYALHGKLYDRDPFGNPAAPGCLWSRLQVPTSAGLRWLDREDCQPSDGPP